MTIAGPSVPVPRSSIKVPASSKREQRIEKLRQDWMVTEINMEDEASVQKKMEELAMKASRDVMVAWVVPATSVMTPAAFGADWTDVYFGASLQNRSRYTPRTKFDAGWTVGFGLFDSHKYVGLEIDYSDYDVDHPFSTGGFGFKLHRTFEKLQFGIGVGWINAILLNEPDDGSSYFVVASKYFLIRQDPTKSFSALFFHLGAGNGRFRFDKDRFTRTDAWNLFGAAALRVFLPMTVIANWTGSDLVLGVSASPFRRFPLIVTVAAQDVIDVAGDGMRFLLAVGYGDSVKADTFPIGIFR